MEGRDPLSAGAAASRPFGGRLLGVVIAGALAAAVATVTLAFLLVMVAHLTGRAGPFLGFRDFLRSGGWFWLPLWGAALGALRALAWARGAQTRVATAALGVGLALLPVLMRPALVEPPDAMPRTPRAKARAILKWSYQSPEGVARILLLSRDPDALIRQHAVLALGVNLIVTDIERPSVTRPSRFRGAPLRDSLRVRLVEALGADPVEAVRVEAARALWKSPVTFGPQPAAAETLAAVLDRAARPGAVPRLAWLALDGAAGAPHPALKAAAARFAAATPDTQLARVARMAADSTR